jgi:cystathionine gamma-synthase
MKRDEHQLEADTWLVAAGRPSEPGDPLNTPMVPASNFLLGHLRGYARDDGSPTWEALEELVGGLERGKSVAFSSGMAAVAALFQQLQAGANVVLPRDCYQGVLGLAADGAERGFWNLTHLEVDDTAAWIDAAAHADLIWLESPSNPMLTVADLAAICAAPRKPGSILGVDNTFATPLNQQPLELGADVSMQSGTKFIGGHSDLLTGVVTTRDEELLGRLRRVRMLAGATPGTLEAYLALRGARTLALRLARAQATAEILARRLEKHSAVDIVRYPGLPSHPTHEIAAAQLAGYGTIISFDVAGGAATADFVCQNTRLIRHATSLGAVESTMERRAANPGQEHVPESMVRLSVGIENAEDLWRDLDGALSASDR